MKKVTVECANAQDIRLKVTAELTVAEWQEVLRLTKDVRYYDQLNELLGAIGEGIQAISKREAVDFKGGLS